MKNKRSLALILLALVLVCAAVGSVVAYMVSKTEQVDNKFQPATVACEVVEAVSGNTKTSITVKNTGNVDAYLRVRLVTYWVDSEGNRVYKASASLDGISYDSTKWLKDGDTYYYIAPVAAGEPTENLLTGSITLVEEDGYKQVVEVFAEAIQADPTTAVKDAWGVTLDSNGNITATN